MQDHLQQVYTIRINGQPVQMDVEGDVVYEEQPGMINTLNFSLKRTLKYIEVLKIGHSVEMEGGTFDPGNRKIIFKGVIKRLQIQYAESGFPTLQVQCFDGTFSKATRTSVNFCYPQKNSARAWARVSKIKASEIVRNIIQQEMKLPVGDRDQIAIAADKEYTLLNPICQDYQTDWAFLLKMAERLGCVMWSVMEEGTQKIYFVDRSKAANVTNKISFLYPLRDEENDFIQKELKENQQVLRELNVEEDVDQANANMRTVTRFDYEKGEEFLLYARTEEDKNGKKTTYYYELDDTKFDGLPDSERKRLMDMGIDNIPFEESVKFFKEVAHVEGDVEAFDGKTFVGIRVSASTDGNVNIVSKQSYMLYGIAKYSSRGTESRYYLESLRHRFGGEGFITEMDFRR
jgi:hypothetical protein